MRLKYIEIQGFKSFPDKTRLTFEQDITAVIGPNGSGKSNISDAIRWVLGEQSNKSLRGKTMEDVIFSGTKKRSKLHFAEVSITIDNADRRLAFDKDDITVTRRYFRSGESEYRINNATVRLKDVNELFMDTGLGRDGYSMIGQGRIDEIVGSKSDERRDIFEEAAGISRFRYRKQEAERKLNSAEQNLERLRDIIGELEGRVEPLRIQSEKAQEFLSVSVEKRELEIGLWLNTLHRSKDTLREQDYKITLAKTEYERLERELTELEKNSELNKAESQRISVEIDAIRRAAAAANEQMTETKSEIAVIENTILHNIETTERLQRDIDSVCSADTADAQISEKQRLSENIVAAHAEKTGLLNSLLEKLAVLSDDSGDFSKQIEDGNHRLNEITAKISEHRVTLITAQTSTEEINLRLAAINGEREKLSRSGNEFSEEIKRLNIDMERTQASINECGNILNGFELKLKSRNTKLDEKKLTVDKIRLDIGETERRIKILEDLERNMEGFSYAVKAVSRESQRGALRGIHGAVSRLIGVPADYATAIETALGAASQNIIVSTEEDAKRAISYLKNNNAGRATFLPISSIRGNSLREQGVDGCIGFVGIASELVEYDKKYAEIVSSLLGRTVICEDMDSAVALAKKFGYRFRVVTLDGQVINSGGSLTGGSHSKNAGLLNRTTQIEQLRVKLGEQHKQLSEGETLLKSATEEAALLNAQLTAAQSELATANEDKIRLLGELKLQDEQARAVTEQLKSLDNQQKNGLERICEYEKSSKLVENEIAALEIEKENAQMDISSLSGGRDKLSERRNELSESISTIRLELISLEKDRQTLTESIALLLDAKQNSAARVEQLNAEIAEIEQKNVTLRNEIEQLNRLSGGFIQQQNTSNEDIERLTARRLEIEQQSYKSRSVERDLLDDKEKLSSELARLSERKQMMQTDYDDIISRLYDEYELTVSAAEEIGIVIEDIPQANKRLNTIRNKIRSLGSVNVAAIEEYKEVAARYNFLTAQVKDVEQSKRELIKLISNLTDTMRQMFLKQFTVIAENFTEVFKELFGGGSAQLKLTEPDDVLESGIDIIAQPPGKTISIIEQLSGGEKALIAVAIYFAIMKVNPPPFCLLDEVEAALDEVNVDKVAAYLRRMSANTQFIVITHRRGTMEEADVLYGVTMQEKGVSKLLSIDVSQIEKTLETKPER